jgi:hypothetical protein
LRDVKGAAFLAVNGPEELVDGFADARVISLECCEKWSVGGNKSNKERGCLPLVVKAWSQTLRRRACSCLSRAMKRGTRGSRSVYHGPLVTGDWLP